MEKILAKSGSLKETEKEKIVSMLSQGKIIAIPTETVYGLAARADNKKTVRRLSALKERPQDKPFSLSLANSEKAVNQYFSVLTPFGYKLIENFWPGSLTIVYYQKEGKKVGIRIPDNSLAAEILKQIDFPLFLPSANRRGQKEAVCADEVEAVFGNEIDLVVDGGKTEHREPSTVIDLTYKPFKILREGVISENDIAAIFIKKRILFVCTGNSCRSPMAEYLFREQIRKTKGIFSRRYEIISAGITAVAGTRPAQQTERVLKEEENIDITEARANFLTKKMILSSDYIFTMDDSQSRYILEKVPWARARVFNLTKFLSSGITAIPDPIGKSFDFYKDVYNIIKEATKELADWL